MNDSHPTTAHLPNSPSEETDASLHCSCASSTLCILHYVSLHLALHYITSCITLHLLHCAECVNVSNITDASLHCSVASSKLCIFHYIAVCNVQNVEVSVNWVWNKSWCISIPFIAGLQLDSRIYMLKRGVSCIVLSCVEVDITDIISGFLFAWYDVQWLLSYSIQYWCTLFGYTCRRISEVCWGGYKWII